METGEKIFETAKREAKEESGLELSDFEIISVVDEMHYIKSDDKHYVNIGVLAKYRGGEPKVMKSNKCEKWRWFSLENLPNKLFEGIELTISNYKRGKIY